MLLAAAMLLAGATAPAQLVSLESGCQDSLAFCHMPAPSAADSLSADRFYPGITDGVASG